jgi:hypothetical protein
VERCLPRPRDRPTRGAKRATIPKARPATLRVAMRAGMTGLSLGFEPQVTDSTSRWPHQALRIRRSAFVLVLVLEKWGWGSGVLEYCALSELRPRSGAGGAEGAGDRRLAFYARHPHYLTPQRRLSTALSASPTRYAGAIRTGRSTPTFHYSTTPLLQYSITPRGRIRARARGRF